MAWSQAQLSRAKAQLQSGGRELLGSLLFTCSGRGPAMFGGADGVAMMDACCFREAFGAEVPMTGFYAGGEIGPQVRGPVHQQARGGPASVSDPLPPPLTLPRACLALCH